MQSNRLGNLYLRCPALSKSVSCRHHFEGCWEHELILRFLVEPQRQRGHWLPEISWVCPSRWAIRTSLTSRWGVCWKPKDGVQWMVSQNNHIQAHEAKLFRAALWKLEIHLEKVPAMQKPHQLSGPLFWEAKTTLITSTHGGEKVCRLLLFPVMRSSDVARRCVTPGQGPQFCSSRPPGQPDDRDC